jgi:hypothetical protein
MVSSVPSTLSAEERAHLVEATKDWAAANGLTIRPLPTAATKEADPAGALVTHVPVTLFPSRFPRKCFEQAEKVQPAYNELYARISDDEEFLGGLVNEYVEAGEGGRRRREAGMEAHQLTNVGRVQDSLP